MRRTRNSANRAASGARGRSRISPTRFRVRPRRAPRPSPPQAAAPRPPGSGMSAARIRCGATRPGPRRNARRAQAQPTVSATATRAWKPCVRGGREVAAHAGSRRTVGAARNVKDQAVGRVEADQRRTRSHQSATLSTGCRSAASSPARRRAGIHGTGIGEWHVVPQAEPAAPRGSWRRSASALSTRRVTTTAASRRAHRSGCGRAGSREAIRRVPPEPQGEIAPWTRGSTRRHMMIP